MPDTKYLAWDIEIAKIPQSDDWKSERPLGICCAATIASDEDEPWLYYGRWEDFDIERGAINGVVYEDQMSQEDCCLMVHDLMVSVEEGYKILTWNGLGFDFDILAEESGMMEECRQLALHHVDPMFEFFCRKGFPVGLEAVSRGMRLSGKTEGVDGSQAPQMWADGKYAEVLEYVGQDVRATLEVARAIENQNMASWVSKSGRLNRCAFGKRLLTVTESLQLFEPNTSWMSDPWPRSRFLEWMQLEGQPST